MNTNKSIRTVLISVYNKDGITEFAESLITLGWRVLSSGGTAEHLTKDGVSVTDVADITKMKAILGHRVVTLHPKIHGGLLALDTPAHLQELLDNDIPWIDMVVCDFYPLEEEVKNPNATRESVINKTDIGGPTQVRSGAKGRRIVICDPNDRQSVLRWLNKSEPNREMFINALAAKAEYLVAHYCSISAQYHSNGKYRAIFGEKVIECTYGENVWQTPAFVYRSKGNSDPLSIWNWKLVAGNPLSYNNICDIDRMIQTMTHIGAGFEKNFFGLIPNVAIGVKHGNCCGAGFSEHSTISPIELMLMGDLQAIFGGLIMCNFPITGAEAEILSSSYMVKGQKRILDSVCAVSFDEDAVEILSRKNGKCRLLANPAIAKAGLDSLDHSLRFRHLRGGDFLEQPNYDFVINFLNNTVQVRNPYLENVVINERAYKNLVFAWAIGSTSNSNTITICKDERLYGNGAGQKDRSMAAKLALDLTHHAHEVMRTNLDLEDAVVYSDSFFPFPDGPKYLIDHGVRFILTSSGSIRDEETVELCKERKVFLFMIPDKIGRGFFGH